MYRDGANCVAFSSSRNSFTSPTRIGTTALDARGRNNASAADSISPRMSRNRPSPAPAANNTGPRSPPPRMIS